MDVVGGFALADGTSAKARAAGATIGVRTTRRRLTGPQLLKLDRDCRGVLQVSGMTGYGRGQAQAGNVWLAVKETIKSRARTAYADKCQVN